MTLGIGNGQMQLNIIVFHSTFTLKTQKEGKYCRIEILTKRNKISFWLYPSSQLTNPTVIHTPYDVWGKCILWLILSISHEH